MSFSFQERKNNETFSFMAGKMIYDYKCKSCGYEEKDKYSLKPLERVLVCPKCKKRTFERQVTRTSFVLKWNEKEGGK